MRMAELEQEAPLAEDSERLGIGGERRVGDAHNLDSYLTRSRVIGVLIVLGQVDFAHTTAPNQAEQPIVPEGLALQMCHPPPSFLPSVFFLDASVLELPNFSAIDGRYVGSASR
jgi:hypothetical protein